MSAIAAAAGSATTDWTTYDGAVPERFMFTAVFWPVLMAAFIIIPGMSCYFCLAGGSRGRIVQYVPPNGGGYDGKGPLVGQ